MYYLDKDIGIDIEKALQSDECNVHHWEECEYKGEDQYVLCEYCGMKLCPHCKPRVHNEKCCIQEEENSMVLALQNCAIKEFANQI